MVYVFVKDNKPNNQIMVLVPLFQDLQVATMCSSTFTLLAQLACWCFQKWLDGREKTLNRLGTRPVRGSHAILVHPMLPFCSCALTAKSVTLFTSRDHRTLVNPSFELPCHHWPWLQLLLGGCSVLQWAIVGYPQALNWFLRDGDWVPMHRKKEFVSDFSELHPFPGHEPS